MKMNRALIAFCAIISFVGIGIGIIIVTLTIINRLEFELKPFNFDLYKAIEIAFQFLLFGVGFWTLRVALISSNSQKKQWLNNSFIKHEANLLLEFKDKANDLYDIVLFINRFYTSRRFSYNPIQGKEKKLRKEKGVDSEKLEFIKNFNMLCDMNDFYNKNQVIFKKNNLDEGMSILVFFLRVLENIDIDFLDYELASELDNLLVFKLKRWPKIIGDFCYLARIEIEGFDSENIENNAFCYSGCSMDEITGFNENLSIKYLEKLTDKVLNLVNDISDKTTYFDDKSELQRASGRRFYYFNKIINNVKL